LAIVNISGSLIAGIVALLMAIKGYGVWSLVLQMLAKSFIMSLFLWLFNDWRPGLIFSWQSLKYLFNYGSRLTIAGLIYTIFQNIYFNIIGKFFPVTSLGFYTRAVQLQEFPVKTVSNIFNRVVFPVFSTIQDDDQRLKNAVRKTNRTMVFVTFPLIFGLIATADYMIEIILTA
jgi:O-antigen/teichoic acid export membrane protein